MLGEARATDLSNAGPQLAAFCGEVAAETRGAGEQWHGRRVARRVRPAHGLEVGHPAAMQLAEWCGVSPAGAVAARGVRSVPEQEGGGEACGERRLLAGILGLSVLQMTCYRSDGLHILAISAWRPNSEKSETSGENDISRRKRFWYVQALECDV
jgi:hypothetical protein